MSAPFDLLLCWSASCHARFDCQQVHQLMCQSPGRSYFVGKRCLYWHRLSCYGICSQGLGVALDRVLEILKHWSDVSRVKVGLKLLCPLVDYLLWLEHVKVTVLMIINFNAHLYSSDLECSLSSGLRSNCSLGHVRSSFGWFQRLATELSGL